MIVLLVWADCVKKSNEVSKPHHHIRNQKDPTRYILYSIHHNLFNGAHLFLNKIFVQFVRVGSHHSTKSIPLKLVKRTSDNVSMATEQAANPRPARAQPNKLPRSLLLSRVCWHSPQRRKTVLARIMKLQNARFAWRIMRLDKFLLDWNVYANSTKTVL